ncbi:hypothetical protein K439DRAFT_1626816, partial [Ramaria rubella]
ARPSATTDADDTPLCVLYPAQGQGTASTNEHPGSVVVHSVLHLPSTSTSILNSTTTTAQQPQHILLFHIGSSLAHQPPLASIWSITSIADTLDRSLAIAAQPPPTSTLLRLKPQTPGSHLSPSLHRSPPPPATERAPAGSQKLSPMSPPPPPDPVHITSPKTTTTPTSPPSSSPPSAPPSKVSRSTTW